MSPPREPLHAALAVQAPRPMQTRRTPPSQADEQGETFEVWLVERSFALLAPVCILGLVTTLLFLCFVDPLYYFLNLWTATVPLAYLIA